MTQPEAKSLHRKLAQIMYEAERIPKRGVAPREMGGYSFVQVGDAADFVRKALAEKLITMLPTSVRIVGQQDRPTKSGGSMTTTDLIVAWTISDGESGESIVIESFGAGSDGGDKYSGKATTSAMKYALLTMFLLSTGEDSELGHDVAHTKSAGSPSPAAAGRTSPRPAASTVPPEPDDLSETFHAPATATQGHEPAASHDDAQRARAGGSRMTTKEVLTAADTAGISTKVVGDTAQKLWGTRMLNNLDDEQRAVVWAELSR